MALKAVRGTFVDFTDDPWKYPGNEHEASRFVADGLLVIDDGIIIAFGENTEVSERYPDVEITEIRDRIIVPGFIDGHIHFPQTRILGAYGEQLLPWLQKWVFPEELKYADRDYAIQGAVRFFDTLLASGTTTAQTFTSSSPVATEELFEEASRRGMRMIAGLTGIDRNAPEAFLNTPESFYAESSKLIETYSGVGRNLYAVTPRFAFGASPELLEACRRLLEEHPGLWVNTHVSENPAECRGVSEAHPGASDYLSVYEQHGLVRPKFTGGHGVWLTNSEFDRLEAAGAAVSFCPSSNLFLGSGLFRLGRVTDPAHRVRMSIGTDMGGGNRFSLLNSLEDAYKVGMLNNTLLDGSVNPREMDLAEAERNKLSAYRGFYALTLGGAESLYIDELVGNFGVGKEADFVALDWKSGPPALEWHQSLITESTPATLDEAMSLLFGVMMVGDERCVDSTWIMGEQAYAKS